MHYGAVHTILLGHAAERALAMMILRYSEALEQVVEDYRPNQLTNYLFNLANGFHLFRTVSGLEIR